MDWDTCLNVRLKKKRFLPKPESDVHLFLRLVCTRYLYYTINFFIEASLIGGTIVLKWKNEWHILEYFLAIKGQENMEALW